MALIGVVLLPLVAAFLCWLPPFRRAAWIISVTCLCLDVALALVVAAEVLSRTRVVGIARWIEADALSALMLVLVSFVCALAAFFARDYMRHDTEQSRRIWWFYCDSNLFAFALMTMIGAPISLLGFLVLFWAYRTTGAHAPETWVTLSAQAAFMPPALLRLAFLLVFVGFGAKVGLAPKLVASVTSRALARKASAAA